jgi:hypothetical protein
VGDTVRDDTRVNTRGGIGVTEIGLLERHLLEIGSETSNVDGGVGVFNIAESNTTILESLIYNLQKFTLLGVHPHRLDRRDVEQCGVEFLKTAVQEVTTWHIE